MCAHRTASGPSRTMSPPASRCSWLAQAMRQLATVAMLVGAVAVRLCRQAGCRLHGNGGSKAAALLPQAEVASHEPTATASQAQERIHRTLGIPEPFGEGLYVLNYQIGQKVGLGGPVCVCASCGLQLLLMRPPSCACLFPSFF